MDRGDIQEAKSIEMDDGLDAMSDMDGVKDGSQFLSHVTWGLTVSIT